MNSPFEELSGRRQSWHEGAGSQAAMAGGAPPNGRGHPVAASVLAVTCSSH